MRLVADRSRMESEADKSTEDESSHPKDRPAITRMCEKNRPRCT